MKKHRKVVKRIVGIICIAYLAMWFLCFLFFLFGLEGDIVSFILSFATLPLMIFVCIGITGGLSYLAVVLIRFFIKNSITISKVIEWIIILGIINIIIGGIIYYRGTTSSLFNKYNVDEVMVIETVDDKLIIDYTAYNDGDYATFVIDKPFYLKVKPYEYISVRYPYGNPRKMRYIISAQVGINMVVIGFVMIALIFYLAMLLLMVSIPYSLITKRNEKKKTDKKEKKIANKKNKTKSRLSDKKNDDM